MKHKIKVVMLPTEDKTTLVVGNKTKELIIVKDSTKVNYGKAQYLYITVPQSVEPIKEGDWYFESDLFFNSPLQANKEDLEVLQTKSYGYRKIIATTDPKLKLYESEILASASGFKLKTDDILLSQVQQSFLKEYVDNPDGEWEVEYHYIDNSFGNWQDYNCYYSSGKYTYKGQEYNFKEIKELHKSLNLPDNQQKLKLNQDNTVTITSVEEKIYNGIDLMGNQEGSLDHFLLNSSKYSQEDRELIMDAVYDWIKENLKT